MSCAITGAVRTPSMSSHLPITPEEIARQSVEAADARAAIVHLHARDPRTGHPPSRHQVFVEDPSEGHNRAQLLRS
ncbi:3-keto-5-aminohexanoate cleavage protein [Variovorax sp. PBS-H4]|uniref:3-keto-5-aminohexanoate cleavage protein n=1 Tax=Variovorax sp. PBS-H4 TaxID=434008 RepID=UPI0022B2A688|nr:3-keto-5-aminohexanoate cleavage protein [Variovorax sp. PBS-H4]